jgi:hypothetical protein
MAFISDIFEKTVKVLYTLDPSYSQQPVIQRLNERLTQTILGADYFCCDLYADTEWIDANPAFRDKLLDYFSTTEGDATADYLHFFLAGSDSEIDEQTMPRPAVVFVLATESLLRQNKILSQLKLNSGNYLFYIFINVDVDEANLKRLKYNFQGKAVTIPYQNLTKGLFIQYIENNLVSTEGMKEMQTLGYLRSVKSLLQDIYRNILTEKKSVDKLLIEKDKIRQEINKLSNDRAPYERLARIKTNVQRNIRDLEKTVRKKYADQLLPNNYIAKFVERMTARLLTIDTKDSLDTRFPRIITSIDADYIATFENSVASYLKKEFSQDQEQIQDGIRALLNSSFPGENGQDELLSKYISPTQPFPEKEKLIASYSKLGKDYQGEMPKSNFQTYLMQIRQQTFFIFIIVALLSPLFSLPVLFFKNPDYQKMENIRSTINLVVGLISIGFTVYLVFDIRKKTPLIKQEQFTKELERMRREVRVDGNRLFTDAIRDWLMQINTWFMEFSENLNVQMESLMNLSANHKRTEIDALENRSASLLQDINDKNKAQGDIERSILSLITEYNSNIGNYENRVSNVLLRFKNVVERAAK